LINNAGIFHCRPFVHHTGNQMQRIIQINLIGNLSTCTVSTVGDLS
jgi:short-subunit dehydrogenase